MLFIRKLVITSCSSNPATAAAAITKLQVLAVTAPAKAGSFYKAAARMLLNKIITSTSSLRRNAAATPLLVVI